jgi:predicted ATPase
VETHSDHVINGVRVAVKKGIVKPDDVNIAFFERKRHEIVLDDGVKGQEYYADVRNIKIDANGSLSEYPEDFMDEWSNQLMRLMRPRTK